MRHVIPMLSLAACALATNHAPDAAWPDRQHATQGELFTFDLSSGASDQDRDPLSYSLLGLPTDSGLTLTGSVLSGTPTEADVSAPQPLTLAVLVRDDEGASTAATIEITVVDTNIAPTFTAGVLQGTQGEQLAFDLDTWVSDPEGEALTLTLTGLPVGTGLRLEADTHLLLGAPTNADAMAPQPLTLGLVATDPQGATSNGQISLQVLDVNDAPEVHPLQALSVPLGGSVTVDVAARFRDPDGDLLTFVLTPALADSGLVLSADGQLQGHAGLADAFASPRAMSIQADDGRGGTVQAAFTLTVTEDPLPLSQGSGGATGPLQGEHTGPLGRTGGYWMGVPQDVGPNQPYGVMIFLHPDGSAENYLNLVNEDLLANSLEHGLMLIVLQEPDLGFWWAPRAEDNVAWIDDFLQQEVLGNYNIDPNRVFFSGISGGTSFASGFHVHTEFRYRGGVSGVCGADIPRLNGGSASQDPPPHPGPTYLSPQILGSTAFYFAIGVGDDLRPLSIQAARYYDDYGFDTVEHELIPGRGHCNFDPWFYIIKGMNLIDP